MTSVVVQTTTNNYNVLVGSNLLDQAGRLIAEALGKGADKLDRPHRSSLRDRCAVICDSNVAPRFANRLKNGLTSAGFEMVLITIPPGEESKMLTQVGEICDQMLAAKLDRQSFVIGLGGGVIGDISGFAAAIFQRGIPHIQIPTTLLAMVDSSIGGKTGVNTNAGKNLIGAVHQPSLVIDDIDVLKTVPPRGFRQGFAEIIKHAIIADAQMFRQLKSFEASDAVALQQLIKHNIEIKAAIVAKDELDRSGQRAILNFGHTVGHGIEQAGDYKTFLHGEAISLGMVAAAAISIKRAGLTANERDSILELLAKFDLPTRLPKNFSREKILDALKFDKKFERGEIRVVVTPKIGSAHLSADVTMEDIREAVEKL